MSWAVNWQGGACRRIDELQNHYIVCAYGRVGRAAVAELAQQGADLIVVEVDASLEADLVDGQVL